MGLITLIEELQFNSTFLASMFCHHHHKMCVNINIFPDSLRAVISTNIYRWQDINFLNTHIHSLWLESEKTTHLLLRDCWSNSTTNDHKAPMIAATFWLIITYWHPCCWLLPCSSDKNILIDEAELWSVDVVALVETVVWTDDRQTSVGSIARR